MRILIPILLATLATCQATENKHPSGGKQWAVLATGATTYENYGLQSDIAHAYKILIRRGVPAENIIVIMADDVAHSPKNPHRGVLINKPDGPDVYKGIKIDYKHKDVTVKTVLSVLAGDKKGVHGKGTGRVLESGPNDVVFLNIATHGGSGVLIFPDGNLHAEDLIKTLKSLSAKKRFSKFLIYLESCFSGSMFHKLLPRNTEIYATTSADPKEFAWFCYCNYKNYPCLGSYYSVAWMQQTDKKLPNGETIHEQYKLVKKLTTSSHVSSYGDKRLQNQKVDIFIGHRNIPAEETTEINGTQFRADTKDPTMYYYKRMAKFGHNKQERMNFANMANELQQKRNIIDEIFNKVISKFASEDEVLKNEIENTYQEFTEAGLKCQKKLYSHFSSKCFHANKNVYGLRHFYKLANVCELTPNRLESAFDAIDEICNELPEITGAN